MSTLNDKHPDFKLTYELALIEHLGLNLYSEIDSALAELIANAYDAEAKSVTVTMPLGQQLGLSGQEIVIADTGHGMTYEEARDQFLRIGRNRRRASKRSKNDERTVIGKKGIGKLAGFGVASVVTVSTVSDGKHTEFKLRFSDLESAPILAGGKFTDGNPASALLGGHDKGTAPSPDAVREYRPILVKVNEPTTLSNSTTITLSELRQLDAVDAAEFKEKLARKFAVFGDDFCVTIIDPDKPVERVEITKFDVPCQFRFPETGWGEESVNAPRAGKQTVKYWIGFTKGTIKEVARRGISVIANGKSVQDAFDFHLTGGTHGQFGLQYMTGEVIADWLDNSAVDVIASDRASVRWSDPDAKALLEWGRNKVRSCLDEWVRLRATKTIETIKLNAPEIYKQIEAYKGPAQEELRTVIDRIVSTMATLGEERTEEVVTSVVNAYAHEHIRKVLNKVAEAEHGFELFVEALSEWDVIDAVLTFQDLTVKLAAIQTLDALIEAGATEVKGKDGHMSLSEHLAENPWLIDPMFKEMEHEIGIDNFLKKQYGEEVKKKDEKRVDFIALYNSSNVRIIELKSAKSPIDLRGVNNLVEYHHRTRKGEGLRGDPRNVRSLLIYNGDVKEDAEALLAQIKSNRSEFEVYTWRELLARNVMIYKEQLARVRAKNPTDPRVVALWNAYQAREGAARSSTERRASERALRKASEGRKGRAASAKKSAAATTKTAGASQKVRKSPARKASAKSSGRKVTKVGRKPSRP